MKYPQTQLKVSNVCTSTQEDEEKTLVTGTVYEDFILKIIPDEI